MRRGSMALAIARGSAARIRHGGGGSRAAAGARQGAQGEACVEPLPVIRRDHMKFLMHQRDDTVHEGIRGARHSLVGCIDCHAAKDDRGSGSESTRPASSARAATNTSR